MTMVLVDTGVLYAMADSDDAWHKPVKIFLEQMQDVLVVPITVLPEACYLLSSHLGPESERKLISSIVQGEIRIESLAKSDFRRTLEILKTYSDMNIGFVDASLVAVAERLKIHRILTTDRKHFSIIRPHHCRILELLP